MQHINNDIKKGQFSQIYLLCGEEGYLIRQYAQKLEKALCGEGDSMNVHHYEGKDLPVGEIIDLAETLPFLAERRVIFISESGLFKENGEKMAEYLTQCNETTFFVFSESKVDKRGKLYKTVQKNGYIAEFKIQDENTLKKWVGSILRQEGKKISENTAMLFLSKTGADMENIRMELEKLVCYCMDSDVITDEDVEKICTVRVANHIFEMVDAVAAGQTKKALELYYDLLSLKEAPLKILSLIARQFNLLLQTKEMKKRGFDAKTIAVNISLPPFVAGKYVAQSSKFTTQALKKAIERCVETDANVKKGLMNDVMGVELLIVSVLS